MEDSTFTYYDFATPLLWISYQSDYRLFRSMVYLAVCLSLLVEKVKTMDMFFAGFEPPKIDCASPFGVEFPHKLPNSAMTSSSQYNQYWGPERGRIRNKNEGSYGSCWLSQYNDEDQWIQVNLGKIVKITRLATQGRYDSNQWVKSYTLSYSVDCGFFETYEKNKVYSDVSVRCKYDSTLSVLSKVDESDCNLNLILKT